jgi:phosphoglycolate phosphatase
LSRGPSAAAPRFSAVFYDLDGTLIDSRSGIEASLRIALERYAPDSEPPVLDGLLGRPLADLLRGVLPDLDPAEMPTLAATFIEQYDTTGWRSSRPYPGVPEVLRELADAGVRQFVLTNKRSRPARAILAAHGLAPLLEATYALDAIDPPFPDKAAMAKAACAAHVAPGERLLVVGDSADDRRMAEACGAVFAAAAWGYGDVAAAATTGDGEPDGVAEGAPRAPRAEALVLWQATEIVDLVVSGDADGGRR